jgi:iron complex outermembrane receptor protein
MRKILLVITVVSAFNRTFAQTVDTTVNLQQVVITANKIEVNRSSIPLSISVTSRQEIESSGESALLSVLSHRVPSLFVTEKGVTGFGVNTNSAGNVNIRGIGQGNKVLMLIDGQPQWAGIFGHSLPDSYVASDVERVEVIRGPGSLLYGSNAMGGVINIITRRYTGEGRQTNARLSYGAYNTQNYMLNNGYNAGNFSSFISVNHDRTDGLRKNSDFNITNGFAGLGYKLNERFSLKAITSLAKSHNQNPGPIDNPLENNLMDIFRGTGSVSLTNSFERSSGAVQLFYNWGRHKIDNGYRPQNNQQPASFLFNSIDHNGGALLYQTFTLFDGNSFTAGLDYKNWGGHAWNDSLVSKRKGEIVNRNVNEIAAYAIMQQDFFNILSLNVGVRYEHNNAYGGRLNPQAGIALRPFSGNSIKLSYSEGYRSPNIRELYISYPPYSMANPELKPETLKNYEASIAQALFNNKLFAEFTAFYLDAANLIEAVNGTMTNVSTKTNYGTELELRWLPLRTLSLSAVYSHLMTSIPTEGAPKSMFFGEASYTINKLTLTTDVKTVNRLRKTGAVDELISFYYLINARASYLIGTTQRGVKLFIGGENLNGRNYEILKGFPMPKRTVSGGVNVTF